MFLLLERKELAYVFIVFPLYFRLNMQAGAVQILRARALELERERQLARAASLLVVVAVSLVATVRAFPVPALDPL